ncbi:MAG TPA: hypothetical protein VJP76_09250 [Candidatus Tumulicola sp.]|nr:hypothetical protein [Candidatus Tumulicola sp.]
MRLMIECPKTGKLIPTGLRFTLASYDAASFFGNQIGCSACGELHLADKTTVKVFPDDDFGITLPPR